MAGEAKEITFHLPDGYSPVDNGLSSVYQYQYAPFVGFFYNTVTSGQKPVTLDMAVTAISLVRLSI